MGALPPGHADQKRLDSPNRYCYAKSFMLDGHWILRGHHLFMVRHWNRLIPRCAPEPAPSTERTHTLLVIVGQQTAKCMTPSPTVSTLQNLHSVFYQTTLTWRQWFLKYDNVSTQYSTSSLMWICCRFMTWTKSWFESNWLHEIAQRPITITG